MEEYAKENGREMVLNKYADCTEEEYRELTQGKNSVLCIILLSFFMHTSHAYVYISAPAPVIKETKPAEPVAEKKPEPVAPPKVEPPKVEPPKAEAKVEEPKVEAQKDEIKPPTLAELKGEVEETPVVEEKKPAPKAVEKKPAPKVEAKGEIYIYSKDTV